MFFVVKKKKLLGKKQKNIVGEKTKKYESYYARKKYC
jgi:hypothetical protein